MRIVITTANRCPQGILWAPHFRTDGSCHCERRQDEAALTRKLRRIDRQGRTAARQARALLRRLGKR
jgi:hypothetical protein